MLVAIDWAMMTHFPTVAVREKQTVPGGSSRAEEFANPACVMRISVLLMSQRSSLNENPEWKTTVGFHREGPWTFAAKWWTRQERARFRRSVTPGSAFTSQE